MTLTTLLGIDHPIICAPMGGGLSTPELVAAVSNAGAMGAFPGAYLTPQSLAESLRAIRALTARPINVNLFAGGYDAHPTGGGEAMLALLAPVHERLGIAPPSLPVVPPDPFDAQLEVILEAKPRAFSFTFGIPSAGALDRVRRAGVVIIGTATTAEEGRLLSEAGVDAIVAQGSEAGAHRGTFTGDFEAAMVPTLELVRQLVAATKTPVIASGGLMDGSDIAAALRAGAAAVQLGTAFLLCDEAGTPPAYRQAIRDARVDTTVITRAFSGRPARGIANEWIERMRGHEEAILTFPQQNSLTRPMRAAAAQKGEAGFLSLWAGTAASRARAMPAAQLVRTLAAELADAISRG